MQYQDIALLGRRVRENIEKVVVGRTETVEMLLAAMLAGGHVLLEDMPGTGKTVLAKSLARSLRCGFARIQFTPDLLPSDITGVSVYRQKEGDFEFKPGPVFTNVLLADEINRATPRTQSALLECMEERQVTEGGVTRALTEPFLVVATQNPVETQGTFPLPEAQLDRFLLRLHMGYPTREESGAILNRFLREQPLENLSPVAEGAEITSARALTAECRVSEPVMGYIISLCEATREGSRTRLGASTRAMLALMRISQAWAALHGRDYVTPDDVKKLAEPALAHRLVMRGGFGGSGECSAFVNELLGRVPAPTENGELDA